MTSSFITAPGWVKRTVAWALGWKLPLWSAITMLWLPRPGLAASPLCSK